MGSNHLLYQQSDTTTMDFKVLLVFAVSATILAEAGLLLREKRSLGLLKAAAVKDIPLAVTAAVLGKYALFKHLKENKAAAAPAPTPVAPENDSWVESVSVGPWYVVDPVH